MGPISTGSRGHGKAGPATGAPEAFAASIRSLAVRLGAEFVAVEDLLASDVAVDWEGAVVGGLRMPGLGAALDSLMARVEAEFGQPLRDLGRADKQRAVQRLDGLGAFVLRRSIEDVADALGVSRITVYNYLAHGS